MSSNHYFVRILASTAAVAMLLSARADASSEVGEGDNVSAYAATLRDIARRKIEERELDRLRTIEASRNKANRVEKMEEREAMAADLDEAGHLAFLDEINRRFKEEEEAERKAESLAERLESMVEKVEERDASLARGADLLDRIAADSVVKTYIDMVDDRIGELMSKLSRKTDVDKEEIRHPREVQPQPNDDSGDVSLNKSPLEMDDLLHRLDSLFRNVLSKQFGRKLAKAFFKHIFPLVAEELQKEEERMKNFLKKEKTKVIEDRRDSFSEFVARPASSDGAEFRARPSFASSGAEFSARASSASKGAEFRARSPYEQYGGVTEGAETLDDWIDLLRAFLF